MLSFSQHSAWAVRSSLLLFCASVIGFADTATVVPTVTSSAGLYTYAYSISYTGPSDAFLVDISVPADPAAIVNLVTPSGFTSQFDSVNGLVSFLEDTSTLTSAPTSGFSFQSADAPGTAAFDVSVADSNGAISTISGTTLAPVAAASAVPEPAYISLLAVMVLSLVFFKRRTLNLLPRETKYVSNS